MKNYRIQFWRILFTYIIALYHLNSSYGRKTSWYIAVEFFFILSGYLLARKFERLEEQGKSVSAWEYTGRRYLKFLPHHIFAFVPAFLVYIRAENFHLLESAQEFVRHIWVLFLVQTIGINMEPEFEVQTQTWYLSVLLFMGALIWYLMKNHKKLFTEIIAPFSVAVIYAYLYRTYGDVNEHQETLGFLLNSAWLRGFAAMCCGVSAYYGAQKIRGADCSRRTRRLLKLLSFAGFTAVVIASGNCYRTVYDFLFIPILTVSVVFAFCDDESGKLLSNALIDKLSVLTFSIFLNHKMFRLIFEAYFPVLNWKVYLLYIAVITIYSAFAYVFVDRSIKICMAGRKKRQEG